MISRKRYGMTTDDYKINLHKHLLNKQGDWQSEQSAKRRHYEWLTLRMIRYEQMKWKREHDK